MNDIMQIRKIYRHKAILIFAIVAVSVVAYFFLMLYMLQTEAIVRQNRNSNRFFSSTMSNLNSNENELASLTADYHANNKIMIHDLVKAYSGSTFTKFRSLPIDEQSQALNDASIVMENCVWLLIVDNDGKVLVSDIEDNVGVNVVEDTGNDMTMDDFKKLCSGATEYIVISNPYYSDPEYNGVDLYLYCEAIPGTYGSEGSKYILLAFTSQILDTMSSSMQYLPSWLNDSTIGNGGVAFVINGSRDSVEYGSLHGKDLVGAKASELGFTSDILYNRFSGMTNIDGTRCYVSVRSFSSELYGKNSFIATVVPANNLYAVNVPVLVWNVFLFAIIILLVIVYSSYIRGEIMKRGEPLRKTKLFTGKSMKLYFSHLLAEKIIPIALASVFILWGAVFYYQTLIKLSDCFSETVSIESDIMRSVGESTELQKEFKNYYNMQYASRAELMSSIVSMKGDDFFNIHESAGGVNQYITYSEGGERILEKDDYGNPVYVLNNSKELKKLMNDNAIEDVYLFSDDGVTLVTSSNEWNYSLPTDPDDASYEFRDIIYGKRNHVIVDEVANDEGLLVKYIGCHLYYYTYQDENGNTKYANYIDYMLQDKGPDDERVITRHRGMLQIIVVLGADEYVLDNSKPEYVLSNTQLSNGGFLTGFEYDESLEDYKVFYSQKDSLIGATAQALGIPDKAFDGNYNGFQTFDSELYLNSFSEGEDYFVSTSLPVDSLYTGSFTSAVFSAVCGLVVLAVITILMVLVSDRGEEKLYKSGDDPFELFLKPLQWEGWKEKKSSEKFEAIVHKSLILLGIIFLLTIIFDDNRMGSNSAIKYIVSGQWDRGIHIFSISACLVIIIVSLTVIHIFGSVSYVLAEAFGNRVVTMMHMVISLIKTFAVILVILYSLYLMGIDATSLLASAGIMSVVVGLGAQSLVGDLLAGIFIILEGSLRVGDYVMINGVRGKVIEIGLRITRYEDDNQNIRVICNNELKSFTNMSMKYSVVLYNMPVPYNEDYQRIKKILNDEFIKLYENNKFLKGIPACQGIENFSESSVDLRIRYMCEEGDRYNVQRFMQDEIMRIFMENDISIPFNQLDVHVEHELVNPNELNGGVAKESTMSQNIR